MMAYLTIGPGVKACRAGIGRYLVITPLGRAVVRAEVLEAMLEPIIESTSAIVRGVRVWEEKERPASLEELEQSAYLDGSEYTVTWTPKRYADSSEEKRARGIDYHARLGSYYEAGDCAQWAREAPVKERPRGQWYGTVYRFTDPQGRVRYKGLDGRIYKTCREAALAGM